MTVLARPGRLRTGLTGTGELTRLAVRRDRIGLAAGVYVITAGVAGTAYTFKRLYPTQAGRAALAATGGGNPALRFLYGRLDGSSLGSLTAWRYRVWGGIFAALPAIFVVIRHTRAWRLQRGALLGWITGYAFTFAASGAAAKGIGQLFGTSTALEREFTRLGGQAAITNAYLAALMLLAGLVAAAYAISVILRLRAEETGAAAEPVLATATSRVRWALSHIAVAAGGAALLLVVAGVAAGLGYGLRIGSAGPEVARMTGAALSQLPSALVLATVAIGLFGLLPRASVAGLRRRDVG